MSSALQKSWPSFQLVESVKNPKFRQQLLEHLAHNDDFCSACREISKNIVKRKLVISGKTADSLRRYKPLITALSRRNNSKRRKQLLVSQSGGWIAAVIPLVASLVGELIRNR